MGRSTPELAHTNVAHKLPGAVLIGVPRAGTTSFYSYLDQHPAIDVSPLKEINFLAWPGHDLAARDFSWLSYPVVDFDDYAALWANSDRELAVDCSISCFRSPTAIERIKHYLGDPKLMVLLRDPVSRAYSAYLNRVRKGYERRSPDVALVPGERTVRNGLYADRLQAFIDAFGRDNLAVWLNEDLGRRGVETMSEVFAYLEVDPTVRVDVERVRNAAAVPRNAVAARLLPSHRLRRRIEKRLPQAITTRLRSAATNVLHTEPSALPADVADRLRAYYAPDIERVEQIIDRDLSSWRAA